MPTYNNECDIGLAMTSILAQDYDDLELLVVNDASTDTTPQIIACFAAQDKRVIPLNNERNLGRALSRNRAIEKARGDLIAILDADDVAMPARLNRQVNYLQAHPEVGMLGAWAIAINPDNHLLEPLLRPTGDADIRRALQNLAMPFVHSTMIFRRNLVISAGMYDARFSASEDAHLCYRVAQCTQTASLSEFLTLYRVASAVSAAAVRTRYRWAAYAGWDLFKQHPTPVGLLNLGRLFLMSCLPNTVVRQVSGVYKNRWRQTLLNETQKSEIQSWLMNLERLVTNSTA
jgi:glycosyltransferase involved in cell wall biosynthesis